MNMEEGPAVRVKRPEGSPDIMVNYRRGDGTPISGVNLGVTYYYCPEIGTGIPTIPGVVFNLKPYGADPAEYADRGDVFRDFDQEIEEAILTEGLSDLWVEPPGVFKMIKRGLVFSAGFLLTVAAFFIGARGRGERFVVMPDHEDGSIFPEGGDRG